MLSFARSCASGTIPSLPRACGFSTAAASTAPTPAELLAQPNIDGALVGGASLKADEFARILAAAVRPCAATGVDTRCLD